MNFKKIVKELFMPFDSKVGGHKLNWSYLILRISGWIVFALLTMMLVVNTTGFISLGTLLLFVTSFVLAETGCFLLEVFYDNLKLKIEVKELKEELELRTL